MPYLDTINSRLFRYIPSKKKKTEELKPLYRSTSLDKYDRLAVGIKRFDIQRTGFKKLLSYRKANCSFVDIEITIKTVKIGMKCQFFSLPTEIF